MAEMPEQCYAGREAQCVEPTGSCNGYAKSLDWKTVYYPPDYQPNACSRIGEGLKVSGGDASPRRVSDESFRLGVWSERTR